MRKIALSLAIAVSLIGLTTSESLARSRHERVKIEPLKENGKVVGLALTLMLRPVDYGHNRVRVALAPAGGLAASNLSGDFREYASGKKKGHLAYQWKEIKGLKTNQNKQVTLKVKFKDAPNLKPGSKVEVVTAWNGSSGGYWHVWGMKSSMMSKPATYKVPNAPKAAATPKPKKPTTARTPKPKKPTTTATPKPKKPKKPTTTATPKPKKPTTTARTPKPKKPTTAATPKPKKPKKPTATASTRRNLQQSSTSSSRSRTTTRRTSSTTRSRSRTASTRTRSRSRAR